ncbi:helix-turn-helix domain-containing protein [Endozoicomonas acroporae]|uniref:helix-turn-helix domain-containing protein n=1 Tax=Endozoicomonas acroporae TaxID=1701104 RepID=UPI003F89243E
MSRNCCLAGTHKKGPRDLGGARGRLVSLPDRQNAVSLIKQAVKNGARQSKACEALGLSERTVQRWMQGDDVRVDNRKNADRPEPVNKFVTIQHPVKAYYCNSEQL